VQEEHDRGHSLTVWFQSGGGEEGFQIYAAPINGDKITPERFQLDEPSGVKQAEKDVSVDGTPAMAFYGANEPMGQTYEIWFTHNGLLYEVMTYKELEPWLNEIMQTWRFL
jgi:hypothetical protein